VYIVGAIIVEEDSRDDARGSEEYDGHNGDLEGVEKGNL